jgi:hypothetical protein
MQADLDWEMIGAIAGVISAIAAIYQIDTVRNSLENLIGGVFKVVDTIVEWTSYIILYGTIGLVVGANIGQWMGRENYAVWGFLVGILLCVYNLPKDNRSGINSFTAVFWRAVMGGVIGFAIALTNDVQNEIVTGGAFGGGFEILWITLRRLLDKDEDAF